MIIFGWGHRTVKKFGPVRKVSCSNCKNESSWNLQKLTSWFTFFFMPIIPYRMDYLLVCPVCRCCLELEKEEFEMIKNVINKKNSGMSEQDLVKTNNIVTEAGGVIRTETQINFIRQMKEMESKRKE
ncbi:zinc-ribbon domain-containing protein [Herbivorax sp. ANBcel31]|uniref:zinc-ribbon domain-containing protein n=1 Tax=Herbivorax sp. ANBcel31 TaxID=3069754 RepID=UPI0027B316A4|nr:zinc-ribbon domain-containing protein [Herbivorax sp. ANBcel31]MDQ2085504.1 zinc-ribbon domain-containing protein [Herbivorax sp. ANBcel31]